MASDGRHHSFARTNATFPCSRTTIERTCQTFPRERRLCAVVAGDRPVARQGPRAASGMRPTSRIDRTDLRRGRAGVFAFAHTAENDTLRGWSPPSEIASAITPKHSTEASMPRLMARSHRASHTHGFRRRRSHSHPHRGQSPRRADLWLSTRIDRKDPDNASERTRVQRPYTHCQSGRTHGQADFPKRPPSAARRE